MTNYRVIDTGINSARTVSATSAREARRLVACESGFDDYNDYVNTGRKLAGAARVFVAVREGRGSCWLTLRPEERQALGWVNGVDDMPTPINVILSMANKGLLIIDGEDEKILMTDRGRLAWAGRPQSNWAETK